MRTEEMPKVRAQMTVTEQVKYEFLVTVEAPIAVVGDPEALTEHLIANEDLWLDDLPIDGSDSSLAVNERTVDDVKILPLAEAA